MLSETEARDRWCPMTYDGDQNTRCVASQCMAWRWDQNWLVDTARLGYCGLAHRPEVE